MIYIIGDSHSCAFTYTHFHEYIFNRYTPKQKGIFTSIRTEPFTIYNINTKIDKINNIINNLNIKPNDFIFFCYGEVDIRCHIGFNSEKNNIPIDDICKNISERYINFLLKIKKNHNNIGVYGPIPSGPSNQIQGNGRPSYKTQIERNNITKKLNKYLKSYCIENNILFKNIDNINNDFYIKQTGSGKEDLTHLSNKVQPILTNLFSDLI